jgi:hypothetical protein
MDNPEKLATWGTLAIGQRQAKHNTENKKKEPPWKPKVNPGSSEGQAASYKTSAMLLIRSICVGHHYTQTNTNHMNKILTNFRFCANLHILFKCPTSIFSWN